MVGQINDELEQIWKEEVMTLGKPKYERSGMDISGWDNWGPKSIRIRRTM
jgi:hypothetical protein